MPAYSLLIRLTKSPEEDSAPVSVKVEVKACFKVAITTTTESVIIPETEATLRYTPPINKTTTSFTTTAAPCLKVDGMKDESFIPAKWISLSSGEPEDLRPGGKKWLADASDNSPEITINFNQTSDDLVYVENIILKGVKNVKTVTVTYSTKSEEIVNRPQTLLVYLMTNSINL